MTSWKFRLTAIFLFMSLLLAGAEKFQVTYLANSKEPRGLRKQTLALTAERFAERLSKTLKQQVKVVPFEKADAETVFLITREETLGGKYARELAGLPLDSFIVRYPVTIKGKKNICLLMGRDAWGYCYPGNYFLREYLGVDCVLPCDFGWVFPDNSKWKMPAKIDVRQSPDFNTRTWTMNAVVDKDFARMQLAESRRNISWHTFGKVLDPKKYGKTNPEYYPLVRGVRRNNPSKPRCDWSPCVSNPDVQKIFVDYLIRSYGAHGSDAVELSVNDGSGNHCECAGCTAWDDPGEKARGHYSNRYFTFYKKVLEKAEKTIPGIKACILLYSDATTLVPAKVGIHPGLVGMSTREETIRRFARNGMKRLGLWEHQLDYLYPLPRHYPQAMKAKLIEMHNIGVREYFGEVYMIAAANAPKQYILGRLLWDLKTDPVKVLEEYCTKAYGPQAAPYVKKYYDTWEKIYIRECVAGNDKKKGRLMVYGPEWFIGVKPGDVEVMAEALEKAEKSKMTELQRKRFMVVKTYFTYLRCLIENYLDAVTLRNSKNLSIEQINKIASRCEARDAVFVALWKKVISKDQIGLYRRVKTKERKKQFNQIYDLYRNAIRAYILESIEIALRSHQKNSCASMDSAARLKYWNAAYKKFPTLVPVAILIGENSGKKLVNHFMNGDFKKGTPGNPKVKGSHPKLDRWYFYEQIGDVQADDYKNHWNLVKTNGPSNELWFGEGKYPEVRTFMHLTAGVYRFSFKRKGDNIMFFNMYRIPTMNSEAFSSVKSLRSHKLRTPAAFSYKHQPSETMQQVSYLVLVEQTGWYVMLIATPSHAPKTWDVLADVKMEKLTQ